MIGLSNRKRNGELMYEMECSICSPDKELYPDGFCMVSRDILKGINPCGCSVRSKLSMEQRFIILNRVCIEHGYELIGFCGDYNGVTTKVKYICPIHGEIQTTYHNLVTRKSSCKLCSMKKLSDSSRCVDPINQIQSVCKEKDGISFVRIVGKYKNQSTKVIMKCDIHGEYKTSFVSVVHAKSGCPKCAITGYNTSKPGWFYVYKYKAERLPVIYKYGITNRDPDERSSEHIRGVDMEISENVFKRLYDDGNVPFNIEQKIKQQFSGVSDWLYSGNTETIYERDLPRVLSIIQEV